MQFITRTIKTYKAYFGHVDLSSGVLVNTQEVMLSDKPGPKRLAAITGEYGTFLGGEYVEEMYCLPVTVFVDMARKWMDEHDERPSYMKNLTNDVENDNNE